MKWIPRLFPYLFVIAGLIMGFWGTRQIVRAKQSASWPPVQGIVTFSKMGTDRNRRTGNRGGDYTMYRADVSYDYMVDSKTYSSSKVTLFDFNASIIIIRVPIPISLSKNSSLTSAFTSDRALWKEERITCVESTSVPSQSKMTALNSIDTT